MAYQIFHLPKEAPVIEAGWKAQFFLTGTTTETDIYTTSALSTTHTNPVVANAAGTMAVIYLDPSVVYKVSIFDENDVLQYTADPCNDALSVSSDNVRYDISEDETSAGVTIVDDSKPYGLFNRYGTNTTPGTTDMTAAIQAAMNSNARAYGNPGETYLVSQTSSRTINGTEQDYCVLIKTGVLVDLNGSTIKLGGSENAALFMSDASAVDFGLVNGVLDGNQANQTAPSAGDMPCVFIYAASRVRVENIKATNVRQYAGRFLDVTAGYFNNLHCTDSDGDGWSFGVDGGYTAQVRQSRIDNISAHNCLGTYGGGMQGNPIILTTNDCVVGSLRGKDSAGGIKIQDSSSNTSVSSVEFDGASNGSANSGFKVQGNHGATLYPEGISVGSVVVRNAYGNGIFIAAVNSVSIASYQGYNNGSGAGASGSDQYDNYINTTNGDGSKSVQLGSVHIDTPTTVGINVLGTGNVQINQWFVRGCTGTAFLDTMTGGTLLVGRGKVVDVSSGLTYGFRSTGTAEIDHGPIDIGAAHSTSTPRVNIAAANYNARVGPVRLSNSDPLEAVVTLSSGTSTSVTNANVWRHYVGGSADNVHPEIEITPVGSSARALGSMYAIAADGASTTGFSIAHASAAGTEKVRYRVKGYSVWSEPAA